MIPSCPASDGDTSALRHEPPEGHFRCKAGAMRAAALSAGLLLALASAGAETSTLKGTPEVLDASRILTSDQEIVLADIAVPGPGEACLIRGNVLDCGALARAGLLDILGGATIECSALDDGRHRCFAQGFDVGFGLIHAGWAVPAQRAPAHYQAKMAEAKARGRGLWSAVPETGEGPSLAHRLQP